MPEKKLEDLDAHEGHIRKLVALTQKTQGWTNNLAQELLWELGILSSRKESFPLAVTYFSYVDSLNQRGFIPVTLRPGEP